MSVELISVLIAMLAVGATLAGLIVSSNRGLRKDMREDHRSVARGHQRLAGRSGQTARAHGAPGRAAGRIARGHHRAGQGQLGPSAACSLCEKLSFPNRSARYQEMGNRIRYRVMANEMHQPRHPGTPAPRTALPSSSSWRSYYFQKLPYFPSLCSGIAARPPRGTRLSRSATDG